MGIRVLGPLAVDAAALRPQERRLLCALALRRGAVLTPDELGEACWGDTLPATWWQQIKTSVARVRRALGGEAVLTRATGYAFGGEIESIDAVRFERLIDGARAHAHRGDDARAADGFDTALALWRGRAFDDLADWPPASIEASRLHEIRATAEEESIAVRLRLGRAAEVLPDAERLLRQEPLRESRWRLLALANYQTGRQAEAIAVLRDGRDRLRREWGLDPGVEHRELELAILRQDETIAAPVDPAPARATCPYPGLRTFTADDADDFFGREQEIDLLVGRIAPGAILTVTGPSGSGKSSLVRAGMLPRLANGDRMTAVLQPDQAALLALRSWRPTSSSTDVILIDQFEELFRGGPTAVEAFATAMRAVLERGAAVVVTVRSDFLDRATAVAHIGDLVGRNVFAVGPLTPGAVREAIERPALRAGLQVEPGLIELILRDGGATTAALPYLSHALAETWARRKGTTLTVEGYAAAGGISGGIAQSAEALYQGLSVGDRTACESVVLRLIERTATGSSVRRQADLGPLAQDPRRRQVIDLLVSARLASVDGSTVMLTHEAIADAWPRLDGWLRDGADDARMLREVQTSTARWVDSGRAAEELARGARLRSYLSWRTSAPRDVTRAEADFLDASGAQEHDELANLGARAERDRRRVRLLRWSLGGAAVLLVIALVAGSVALGRERDAGIAENEARAAALSANARSLIDTDRDLAALLAAESYRRDPSDPRARSTLTEVLTSGQVPTTKILFADDERVSAAAIPGTETVLAIVDPTADGSGRVGAPRAEIWDAVDGVLLRSIDVTLPRAETQQPRSIFIDPQARRAIVATPVWWNGYAGDCCRSEIEAVDLETGESVGKAEDARFSVSIDGAFSADGEEFVLVDEFSGEPIWIDTASVGVETRAVSAGYDNSPFVTTAVSALDDEQIAVGHPASIQVWDRASRTIERSIPLPGDVATWAIVAAPGNLLLVSGPDGVASVDAGSGTVLWRTEPVADRPCMRLRLISDDDVLCVGDESRELRLSDGAPTGRVLDGQAGSILDVQVLGDGSAVAVNHRATPFLQRFPLDGTGPIAHLVAAGRVIAGDFTDDRTITTTPIANGVSERAPSMTLWDIVDDEPLPARPDEVFVTTQGRTFGWTEDVAAQVISDVAADGRWRITDDFETPGDRLVPQTGGVGDLSFAVADDWIVAFDPATGHTVGRPMDFAGKQLHWRWVMVHEIPDRNRALVTWWDREDASLHTAVFDIATGAEITRGLEGDVATIPLPDDTILSADFSGLTLNDRDLEPIRTFPQPDTPANTLELSDDGSTLLLASQGGDAALYDVPSATRIGVDIDATSSDWVSAYLSPNGRTLATNSPAGVLIWDLDPSSMVGAACRLAGRSITRTEWDTFFPREAYADACAGSG